ncbi:GcrA cell cycle regulator [Oleomonas cavernae]|uniref:GcrA cell cycle regulator n=1 Tax=Oleomonas cavernae TaxID=2320859 RepID=A0A418WTF0_9PROT|nr:GcrA family cell cycle regulator [Oleomonas cavernae]RJF94543.1 GcrA cell cycle regulator [Oleomonas cavernae]
MSWTDERIASLRELWEQGLSASQIAAKLGNITRNAVIGKVHRLGLSGRPSPVRAERPAPAPRAERPAPAPRPVRVLPASEPVAKAAAPARVVQAAPAPAPEPEPMVRATLLSINDRMCKWPLGDPGDAGFHFCGRRAQSSMPYCQEHARIAYQAATPKSREKRDRDRERERERLVRSLS